MSKTTLLRDLEKKMMSAENLAARVLKNPGLLPALLDGFFSDTAGVRFKSAKTLVLISEREPGLLYPQFDFFAKNLSNRNNILKWNAIDVIAHLTQVDTEKRFDKLFSRFYGMLSEGSLITAAHVVTSSALVVAHKPYLERRITRRLLGLKTIPLLTEECRNILKGHAIKTFGQYFERIKEKEKVIAFVKKELKNRRSATRKKAERFIKKWAP